MYEIVNEGFKTKEKIQKLNYKQTVINENMTKDLKSKILNKSYKDKIRAT